MASPQALYQILADENRPTRDRIAAVKALIEARPELAENPVVTEVLGQLAALEEHNPLEFFEPHSPSQELFFTARTDIVAAFAGNQFGKCVLSDELVRMADGTTKPIGEIRPGDWVVGVNLDGSTRPARVLAFHDQGVKDVYEYRFSKRGASASFVATADHKMLARPECSTNRILPAGEVTKRWVAQRQLGFDPGESDDPDEQHAMLVGLLLGDGCLTGEKALFTCADPDILALTEAEAERLGCYVYSHPSNPIQFIFFRRRGGEGSIATANPVKALARRVGMGCYAHEKRIPEGAWRWGNAAVARLLAGLLLTDGTVTSCGSWGRVGFCSASRGLVEDVKALLEQRFGVYGAEIHTAKPRRGHYPEHSLWIGNYGSIVRLAQSIPLVGRKRDRLDAMVANWPGKHSDGAGLIFREARYVGRRATCDITIDHPTHLFALANGLVISNSTALIVRALRELLPRDILPKFLKDSKLFDGDVHGWIVCPTNDKIFDPGGLLDVIQRWVPPSELRSGKWEGSWNKERKTLHFRNGSSLGFKTYEQDPSTLGGASLHFVGYDEPPPIRHRNECLVRLVRHGGFEMFAMTPIRTNTGWVRRDIYRQREAPHITVIRGSMHDNPTLDSRKKEMILASFADDERKAREYGDFMELGGLIYPDFERCVVKPWSPEFIRSLDVVVGIDPGIRNCGLAWVGFDSELVAHVFFSEKLQDKVAEDYAKFIRSVNAHFGLKRVSYVIDPAAKQRAQANGMTVLSEINKAGIYPNLGQNDHELGFGQMRARMQHKRFWVSENNRKLRDEADDYAAREPKEGQDDSDLEPVKGNDHILDAVRYACVERFWDPIMEAHAPERKLGWTPGQAPPAEWFEGGAVEHSPMGSMS